MAINSFPTRQHKSKLGFEFTTTIATSGDTETLLIPPIGAGPLISVTAIPGANTASVKSSTSPTATVKAGSGTFQDWPGGDVTSTTTKTLEGAVTALKFTAVGGSCDFEVVA